jgi:pimeloyl-ACP methyl ester carboxylesterase
MPTPEEHLEAHRSAGRTFEAGGVQSFVREQGDGDPVLCFHGVPASCYLYRKVIAELAERGLRGVAFDLPGLGLADRPEDFDYSWTGLGKWSVDAVDALGLDGFHLVIHDIGGPVGLELLAARPHMVKSLTILNTLVCVDGFKKPWVMRPFEGPKLGKMYLATMGRWTFKRLMYMQGVKDKSKCPPDEVAVYVDLLKRQDGGKGFLKMMRSFEPTAAKQELYLAAIAALEGPKQLIWGEHDTALTIEKFGQPIAEATGIEMFHRLPGKHFLQEDNAPAIADLIANMVAS